MGQETKNCNKLSVVTISHSLQTNFLVELWPTGLGVFYCCFLALSDFVASDEQNFKPEVPFKHKQHIVLEKEHTSETPEHSPLTGEGTNVMA